MPRDITRNVGVGRGSVVVQGLRGVHQEVTPNMMKIEEHVVAHNVAVTQRGLLKLPPWVIYAPTNGSSIMPDSPQWLARGFDAQGSEILLIHGLNGVGLKRLDTSALTYTVVPWIDTYTWTGITGFSCAASGSTLTFSAGPVTIYGYSTNFTPWSAMQIKAGDSISINGGTNYYQVASVVNNVVTVSGSPAWSSSPTVFKLTRSWPTLYNQLDWAAYGQYILVTGRGFPLGIYDSVAGQMSAVVPTNVAGSPTTYMKFNYPLDISTSPAKMWAFDATAIAVFRNWVFLGNTNEPDGLHPSRIRWSSGINPLTDFTDATRFLDLPGATGKITKLLPLATTGSDGMLMCYMNEAVYRGYQINLAGQPVAFTKMDTGGVGLLSPRAIVSVGNYHFFAGQDNIYATQGDVIQPIGGPIQRQALLSCGFPDRICATFDRVTERVIFLIPGSSEKAVTAWSYSLREKEWTSQDRASYFIAGKPGYTGLRYQDFGSPSYPWLPVTWLAGGSAAIASFSKAINSWQVLADNGNDLVQQGDFDVPSTDVLKLETSDIDFEQNDIVKDWFRMEVQIDDKDRVTSDRTLAIVMNVYGSMNSGLNWRLLGQIIFPPGKNTGHVNFRLTNAWVRFRLVDAPVAPTGNPSYTVTNYIIDTTYAHASQRTNKEGA